LFPTQDLPLALSELFAIEEKVTERMLESIVSNFLEYDLDELPILKIETEKHQNQMRTETIQEII
jgi:hypothetical protein